MATRNEYALIFASAFVLYLSILVTVVGVYKTLNEEEEAPVACLLSDQDTPEDLADFLYTMPESAWEPMIDRFMELAGEGDGA